VDWAASSGISISFARFTTRQYQDTVSTLIHSGLSRSTSSSVLSDIRRSRVKVRLAEAALQIEHSKLQEVKEQVRSDAAVRADKIRREVAEKAQQAENETRRIALEAQRIR